MVLTLSKLLGFIVYVPGSQEHKQKHIIIKYKKQIIFFTRLSPKFSLIYIIPYRERLYRSVFSRLENLQPQKSCRYNPYSFDSSIER